MHLGDFDTSAVIYGKFTTYRPSTGATFMLAGSPALSVYKDNSVTQSTTGVTLTADFDSVTGLNHFAIDTSADGTFYSAGSFFDIVITTGTVDSRVVWARTSVNLPAGIYVDTVKVHLLGQTDEAYLIDTLSIAQVAAPTPAVAVQQLIKGNGLNADQVTLLDQIGNRNGRYDLGDFLAWITLSGEGVPPALMARLLAAADAPKGATP